MALQFLRLLPIKHATMACVGDEHHLRQLRQLQSCTLEWRTMPLCAHNNLLETQRSVETQDCNTHAQKTATFTKRNSHADQPLYLRTSSGGGSCSPISGCCCKYCLVVVTLSARYVLFKKLSCASGQTLASASTQSCSCQVA